MNNKAQISCLQFGVLSQAIEHLQQMVKHYFSSSTFQVVKSIAVFMAHLKFKINFFRSTSISISFRVFHQKLYLNKKCQLPFQLRFCFASFVLTNFLKIKQKLFCNWSYILQKKSIENDIKTPTKISSVQSIDKVIHFKLK